MLFILNYLKNQIIKCVLRLLKKNSIVICVRGYSYYLMGKDVLLSFPAYYNVLKCYDYVLVCNIRCSEFIA
jgi:hypothetical protein